MSLPRRFILAALVISLTTSASPSGALLLCVSEDGHASIEFAAPGTVHCDEADCLRGVAQPEQHSCRDIPVLSAGEAMVKTPSAFSSAPPPASVAVTATLAVGPLSRSIRLLWDRPAPPPAAALRSVVLTL